MGQAVISALVQMPHIARGLNSRIFDNEIYPLLFHPEHPIEMYLSCLNLLRASRAFLHQHDGLRPHVDDFQYHLTAVCAVVLSRKDRPGAKDLAELPAAVTLTNEEMLPLLHVVQNEYRKATSARNLVLFDQLAKSESVTEKIMAAARAHMRSTPRPI